MHKVWMAGVAMTAMVAAGPALADVKAGFDAWQRGDYKTAVETWRPLAIAGDADAQFDLGQAYKLGRGVPVDPALAESWFQKAANQGHLQAQDNYGLALYQDDKKAEALPWLEKSVARDEPRAQLVLGTMLFNGDGVTRDYPRAYALMTRAQQHGLKAASETLAQMDQYITPADREKGVALAQQYEAQARVSHVPDTGSDRGVVTAFRSEDLPPSRVAADAPDAGAGYPPPGAGRDMSPRRDRDTPAPVRLADAAPPPPRAPRDRPPPPQAREEAPPSAVRTQAPPRAVAHAAPVRPAPVREVASAARPSGGAWRIQLGAFRDAGNAHALWSQVGARVGGRPSFVSAGGLTRLQAGGYGSRGEAEHACAAAHTSCVVVAP